MSLIAPPASSIPAFVNVLPPTVSEPSEAIERYEASPSAFVMLRILLGVVVEARSVKVSASAAVGASIVAPFTSKLFDTVLDP